MRKRENRGLLALFYQIGIITLFLGGFLVLVVFGAVSYRSAEAGKQTDDHSRAVLSYLSTIMTTNRGNEVYTYTDAEAGVKVLVVSDSDGENGWRIYVHDGELISDYALLDSELYPEDGIALGPATVLEVTRIRDDLVAVTTDEGTVYANVSRFRGDE